MMNNQQDPYAKSKRKPPSGRVKPKVVDSMGGGRMKGNVSLMDALETGGKVDN